MRRELTCPFEGCNHEVKTLNNLMRHARRDHLPLIYIYLNNDVCPICGEHHKGIREHIRGYARSDDRHLLLWFFITSRRKTSKALAKKAYKLLVEGSTVITVMEKIYVDVI